MDLYAGYQYCSGRGTWSGTFSNDTFGSVAIDNGLSVTAWADYGQRGAANGWSTSQSNLGWLDDEISSVRANVPHISAMPAILTMMSYMHKMRANSMKKQMVFTAPMKGMCAKSTKVLCDTGPPVGTFTSPKAVTSPVVFASSDTPMHRPFLERAPCPSASKTC